MGGLTVFLAVGPFFMPGDHEKRGGDSIVTVLIGQEIYTKNFWLKKMGLVYEERFPSLNRECLEALKTPLGLFGKRTVVVEAQSLSKGFKELPWAVEKAQNDLVLVLTEYGSTKEAKKLQGLLQRSGEVKGCHQLTPQQFKMFVFRSLKALGEEKGAADGCAHELRITEKAYAAFAERTGYLRRPERGASTSLYPVIGYLRSLAFLDTDDIEERHVAAVVPLDTEGGTREEVDRYSGALADKLKDAIINGRYAPGISIIGPADASISKLNNIYRKIMYIKSKDTDKLGKVKEFIEDYCDANKDRGIRVTLDRDPVRGY